MGFVDQRTAERDLEFLAAGIAPCATVRETGHIELIDESFYSLFKIISAQTLELTIEADVFAARKTRIETTDIGQNAETFLHRKSIARDIKVIDPDHPVIS